MGVSASSLPRRASNHESAPAATVQRKSDCGPLRRSGCAPCFASRDACYERRLHLGNRFCGVRGGGMRPVVWAIAIGLACIAPGCGPRGPQPISAFDGRVQDWTREILADSPELATKTGASV